MWLYAYYIFTLYYMHTVGTYMVTVCINVYMIPFNVYIMAFVCFGGYARAATLITDNSYSDYGYLLLKLGISVFHENKLLIHESIKSFFKYS